MEMDELGTARPIIPLFFICLYSLGIRLVSTHNMLGWVATTLANGGHALHVGPGFKKNDRPRNAN